MMLSFPNRVKLTMRHALCCLAFFLSLNGGQAFTSHPSSSSSLPSLLFSRHHKREYPQFGIVHPTQSLSKPYIPPRGHQNVILHSGNAVPSSEGRQQSYKRRVLPHILPISTAVVIGSFSVVEILESIRELTKRQLGHAHGITILAVIRLCRAVAILQTQTEEMGEKVEEIFEEVQSDRNGHSSRQSILQRLGKFIVSPMVAISACILAAIASMVEIFDDLKPGAHHGAALLALSELYYQIRRFKRFVYCKRCKIPFVPTDRKYHTVAGRIVGIVIAIAAAGFAGFEVYEDIQPGAHHGVAVLALAELVENINRSTRY